MRSKKVKFMLQAAMIAAVYVVLVIIFNYWSFGPIQLRIAEILTIMPYFTPAAIPGLFIGCFIANVIGGSILVDVVFGSVATLLGALGSYALAHFNCKGAKWLVPVPPIIANTLIVPYVLKFGYGMEEAIPVMMLTVGLGEVIVCGICGILFFGILEKYKKIIFF